MRSVHFILFINHILLNHCNLLKSLSLVHLAFSQSIVLFLAVYYKLTDAPLSAFPYVEKNPSRQLIVSSHSSHCLPSRGCSALVSLFWTSNFSRRALKQARDASHRSSRCYLLMPQVLALDTFKLIKFLTSYYDFSTLYLIL